MSARECPYVARYPLLARVPVDTRAAWVAQAERGEELTQEQAESIGLPLLAGGMLIPVDGLWSEAQLNKVLEGVKSDAFQN